MCLRDLRLVTSATHAREIISIPDGGEIVPLINAMSMLAWD
jgi:hypothetical protein